MASQHDLPFQAEYAKSGRSACKGCKENIANDSMRLAVMVKSPFSDGKMPNWFHERCFWKQAKVANTHDIHGFDSLRLEDQEKIKGNLGGAGGDSGSSESPDTFTIEYARSNKSKCRVCEETITRNQVRISKKDIDSVRAKMYGPQVAWHHVDCFVEKRDELGFGPEMNVETIKFFSVLKKEDRDMLIEKLGKGENPKKRKAEDKGDGGGKKQKNTKRTKE